MSLYLRGDAWLIKCNGCMQLLESKNLENHIKKHHFEEIRHSISEKNSSSPLTASSTISNRFGIITRINNSFCNMSKHFQEKIFVQKKLLSSDKFSESSFHNRLPIKRHIDIQSTVKLVCNTCKKEMDSEICRILITYNVDMGPQFFSFHFFHPCWNFENFCLNYPHITLDKMMFSIPENIALSEKGIKDIQNNLSFWD